MKQKAPRQTKPNWAILGAAGATAVIVIGLIVWLFFLTGPSTAPLAEASPSQTAPDQTITIAPPPEPEQPAPAVVKPATLDVLGVSKPQQANIQWTAYYITPAKLAAQGKGPTVSYTDLAGNTKKITLTKESYDQAEVEAVAVGVDKDGVEHFAYRVSPGVWKELPQGCAGMGNKLNALVPLLHVAADQRKFPYGSMVYAPMVVGLKLDDGETMDGYFWIGDVGSGVTGNHFDLFVGDSTTYQAFLGRDKNPTYPTTIYSLPTPPKSLDPRNDSGLAAILRSGGWLKDDATPIEKYKILDALLLFQQANPHIPPSEYGNPRAATTLWFLIQAALGVQAAAVPSAVK